MRSAALHASPRRLVALVLSALLVASMALTASAADPGAPPAAAQDADERPNVLFIVTDDQRGSMEVMPKTRQWFGAEGRRYPNAYVTTPLCCPARASIMSGRYAHNHGVTSNEGVFDIPTDDMVQAQLQAAGYRTALYGKFLNVWPVGINPPNFDDFAVSRPGYIDRRWNVNGTYEVVRGYNTHLIGDFAVKFINDSAERQQPWFMMLAPYGPHGPYTPEPKYANAPVPPSRGTKGTRETDLSDKPRGIRLAGDRWEPDGRIIRQQQMRTLMSVDDLIDRVMTELRATGQENTIAIFLSDNGYLWGEHGYIGKRVPYTEAIKVPFYARWPNRITPGSVDKRLVANVDMVPTVLKAAGLPADDRDGRDLLDTSRRRNRMHLEYWCKIQTTCLGWASTRTKQYQYVERYDVNGRVSFREYYDLAADPAQLQNLFHDGKKNNPPIGPLAAQLRADRRCVNNACP